MQGLREGVGSMDFSLSARAEAFRNAVSAFMAEEVVPREGVLNAEISQGDRWQPLPTIEALKSKAQSQGLWNLWSKQCSTVVA